jgi:hypothetical protein
MPWSPSGAALLGWVECKHSHGVTMCLSPEAFVSAKVSQRLVAQGVPQGRADAIGAKVGRAYELKRRNRTARAYSSLHRAYYQ